jgi:hypothetical protein
MQASKRMGKWTGKKSKENILRGGVMQPATRKTYLLVNTLRRQT